MQSPRALGAALPRAQPPRHALRQRQRAVLMAMIRNAVPLTDIDDDNKDSNNKDSSHAYNYSSHSSGSSVADASAPPMVWRLLIFDDWGRDVLAPLLKVNDLRELGVTLYMHLRTERDAIAGAPALYFCAPSDENVRLIARDCAAGLYEWVYVNFTAQVARAQLELLARELRAARLPSIRHIRVVDRTLNFVALDEDMFTLLLPRSFEQLHSRVADDAAVQAHVDAVARGLLHVVLAQQVVPIVAHTRTGAAEAVARRLLVYMADALRERQLPSMATGAAVRLPGSSSSSTITGSSSSSGNSSDGSRPLLLISDRATDVATALHHPFSYRGLLVELAQMHLNKCLVHIAATSADDHTNNNSSSSSNNNKNGSSSSTGNEEVIELDVDRDAFYRHHAGDDFGALGGHLEAALRAYTAEYTALSAQTSSSSSSSSSAQSGSAGVAIDVDDDDVVMGGGVGGVSRLLANAPRLAERKRYLDAHTKLSYAFLHDIRARQLDHFHGVELAMLLRDGLDKDELARLLATQSGRVTDRQRLCLIAYLTTSSASHTNSSSSSGSGSAAGANAHGSSNHHNNDDDDKGNGEDAVFVQQQLARAAATLADTTTATTTTTTTSGNTDNGNDAAAREFAALTFVKHLRQWSRNAHTTTTASSTSAASYVGPALAWDIAQHVARTLTSTLGSKPDTTMLPLTKLVDALLQEPPPAAATAAATTTATSAAASMATSYATASPTSLLIASPTRPSAMSVARQRALERVVAYEPRTGATIDLRDAFFARAVVFVVGGGCMAEYDNLKTWEAAQLRKSVCYGCTDITSGDDMLAQLTRLGQQLRSA